MPAEIENKDIIFPDRQPFLKLSSREKYTLTVIYFISVVIVALSDRTTLNDPNSGKDILDLTKIYGSILFPFTNFILSGIFFILAQKRCTRLSSFSKYKDK